MILFRIFTKEWGVESFHFYSVKIDNALPQSPAKKNKLLNFF